MTEHTGGSSAAGAEQPGRRRTLSVRQAPFIGVGAMVGPGSSPCSGPPARWPARRSGCPSCSPACIAGLQGYSFAKFGARYPSAGGLLEYVVRGFGNGHVTGVIAWLLLSANAIITAMVAVSFGSYASSAVADGGTTGSSRSRCWSCW